jgi:hypothetical protein
VYTYDKKLIKGWIFEGEDSDIETNQTIDFIINYCEAAMKQIPVSEPDNQLSRVEVYKNIMHINRIPAKTPIIYLYKNTANEDNNVYYIEIDFYILAPEYNSGEHFRQHKIIISNQYFKYSESGGDVQRHTFWNHYRLLEEGESAYKFFLNEMAKHRR